MLSSEKNKILKPLKLQYHIDFPPKIRIRKEMRKDVFYSAEYPRCTDIDH